MPLLFANPEDRFSCVMAYMMLLLGVIYHHALNIYKPPSDLHILFMLQSDAQINARYILQNSEYHTCAFVICKPRRQVFLCHGPYDVASGSDIPPCIKYL